MSDAENRERDRSVVRAAGGLVVRQGPSGETEIAVVHRPKYDDWSFPKGKLTPGESEEEAALREVKEETGLACSLNQRLPSIRYLDREKRPKVVSYWSMEPLGGTFRPTREIDDLRWVPVDRVASMLTYEHDRELLKALDRFR